MSDQWDRNAANGDYVMSAGQPVRTTSLLVPAFIRIKGRRKQWLYAPDDTWGSGASELKRATGNQQTNRELIVNTFNRACQPLVDDGRALAVETTVLAFERAGVQFQTTIVDAQQQAEVLTFRQVL